jgi:hypothetical protein
VSMQTEQNPHACESGGCILLLRSRPAGQHLNSGCRCLRNLDTDPQQRITTRQGIRWLSDQVDEDASTG